MGGGLGGHLGGESCWVDFCRDKGHADKRGELAGEVGVGVGLVERA